VIEVNEPDLLFFNRCQVFKQLHTFNDKRMGDLSNIPVIDLCGVVKSAVNKNIVCFGNGFNDIRLPFFPLVNVGDEKSRFIRAGYAVTNGLRKFIAVRYGKGSDL